MTIKTIVIQLLFLLLLASAANGGLAPEPADLMRPGVGDWCYNPVGPLSETQKRDYVDFAVHEAGRAEQKYGVPGAVLAAMSIRESGYGRTRLAILSNNVLSFKWPGKQAWQFGRPQFILWCQPDSDPAKAYILFGSKMAAFDYVAKVLAERPDLPYAAVTQQYKQALSAGTDRKTAALAWLKAIAKVYTTDAGYVPAVIGYMDNPMKPGTPALAGESLWERWP